MKKGENADELGEISRFRGGLRSKILLIFLPILCPTSPDQLKLLRICPQDRQTPSMVLLYKRLNQKAKPRNL